MSPNDTMTELRELRERLQGADADKQAMVKQLAEAQALVRERDRQLEEITHHRNRLLAEKEVAWGHALAPDTVASEVTAADPAPDPAQLPLLEEHGEVEC